MGGGGQAPNPLNISGTLPPGGQGEIIIEPSGGGGAGVGAGIGAEKREAGGAAEGAGDDGGEAEEGERGEVSASTYRCWLIKRTTRPQRGQKDAV